MKKIILITILFFTHSSAMSYERDEEHLHSQHQHEVLINGENFEIDKPRLDEFLRGLSASKIAIVNVNGMVCDFCARGIEKTFLKDPNVEKIDVDLARGKVTIAYLNKGAVDFEKIKEQILSNGQTATSMKLIKL